MSRVSLLLSLTVVCLTGAISAEVDIIEPIRETGDEVALIFISGGYINADRYKKTAQAIQEASDLRVWVALPGDDSLSMSGYFSVPNDVTVSIEALEKAGMKSENYIGVAHGQGGDYLRPYVGGSKLKAVVFLGAVLPYSSKLEDFPVPILTLVAELDGYTRITRSMGEFTKLENDMLVSPESLYRTPVILLKGSNHGQFASGKMPDRIIDTDLKTDLTEDEAHRMIGKRVNSFLAATFSSSPSIVDTARADIEEAFYEAMEKLQPFFTLRAFELDNLPNWMRMNQEYVAGEFADQIQVHTEVEKNPWFFFSKPSISRGDEDQVVVETKALVDYGRDYNSEVTSVKRSAVEIDMKLKTKDAIWEALSNHDDGPHTSLRSEPMTCKALSEFAWQVAMNYSTQEARDRYRKHRHVSFWEDVIGDNIALWATWSLSYWENYDFNVRGVSLITDLENESNPGIFYCKALSPFRALEWINVDSLKQKWWHF